MSSASAASTHLDLPTRLQLGVSELCGLYVDVLGNLQNAAEERAPDIEQRAADLASQVVEAHRCVDELAAELGQAHRSEEQQMRRLRELEDEGSAVTQQLRSQTEAAGGRYPAHPLNPEREDTSHLHVYHFPSQSKRGPRCSKTWTVSSTGSRQPIRGGDVDGHGPQQT